MPLILSSSPEIIHLCECFGNHERQHKEFSFEGTKIIKITQVKRPQNETLKETQATSLMWSYT